MSLTGEQRRAVEAEENVAIVAGAGCGKTHVLAERYLHHLAADGLSPLSVVAVTFTDRAADELRRRIRGRISERSLEGGIAEPEAALAELEAAQIGTIHALCARVCREHPDEAASPPGFDILDPNADSARAAEWLEDALETLPPETFRVMPYDLVSTALQRFLEDPVIAERSLERGPEGWDELAREERGKALNDFLRDPTVKDAGDTLRIHEGPAGDRMEDNRRAALSALGSLGDCARSGENPLEYLEAIGGIGLRGGSPKKWGEGEFGIVKEALKCLREWVKGAMKRGMITLETGPADELLAEVLPVLREAFSSVLRYVGEVKKSAGVLGFADLEANALRALEHAHVRAYYAERWKAVMVDEFQDTNQTQAEILERLAEGGAKLTVVGDEKQSIYGFRRADVAVFRRFRERILSGGGSEAVLDRSFRAHEPLIRRKNAIFSPVLGELSQELTAHREAAPHEGPHVRAYAIETEGKTRIDDLRRAEAALISNLLREMLDGGTQVHDPQTGGTRPLEPGDIAVLSRAWAPLGFYEEALSAAGVPAVHAGGGDLLSTREAKDATALLRFLTDPADDLALVALLRSPFFAVDDPALNTLAGERAESEAWWDLLRRAREVPEPLEHACEVLEELLGARRELSPGALIGRADRLTGYTAVISNLPGAARREADWRGFRALTRDLERGGRDAFSVVRSLGSLTRSGAEVPRPPLQGEAAVGLMTIHSAKGLEWPVVVVPDLARSYPGFSEATLFDPRLGAAMSLGDEKGVLYRVLAAKKEQSESEEARRVLYVAATRARDHLILTATEPEPNARCALTLLAPGLAAGGVEVEPVPFRAEDAHPPAPEPPAKKAPARFLTGALR